MRRLLISMISVALAFAAGTAVAAGVMQGEYSADVAFSSAGNLVYEGKINSGKDKIRFESPMGLTITRLDLNLTWSIVEHGRFYLELPLNQMVVRQASVQGPGELARKSLGFETISGTRTEKFIVTYQDGNRTVQIYQWLGPEGQPRKVGAVDDAWNVEYRNFKSGPQPAELFEVPAGYTKMTLPNAPDLSARQQTAI